MTCSSPESANLAQPFASGNVTSARLPKTNWVAGSLGKRKVESIVNRTPSNPPQNGPAAESGISSRDPLGPTDVNSVLEALVEFPAHQPPARLYRFFSARAISSLTGGKLKLTPPAEFNDPFEVWAGLSDANLTEENVLRSVVTPGSLFRISMEANYPDYDLRAMDYEKALIAAVKEAPQYYRLHLKSMVDAIASSCANDIGVACFSAFAPEEFHGELGIHHWAMYGDSHTGFAIAYDGEHPQMRALAETKWLFPVEYVDERYAVDLAYFDEWSDRKMWRTFRRWLALKSRRAWEHEKEWRLGFPIKALADEHFVSETSLGDRIHYFLKLWDNSMPEEERSAHASIISAVFLGARATPTLTAQVLEAVNTPHLRHVEVCKMEVDPTKYALVPREVRRGDSSRVNEMRARLARQTAEPGADD